MTEIPGFFKHLANEGEKSTYYRFDYEHETRQFTIGTRAVTLTDFDPYKVVHYVSRDEVAQVAPDEVGEYELLIPAFGRLIVTPKLHEWAQNNPGQVSTAAKVMHESYIELIENPEEIEFTGNGISHWGFAAGLHNDGGIGLQVVGDCACLGATPHGNYINDKFENGFSEYELHNADYLMQRVSLYAGIGYLARLASAAPPSQLRLF